MREDEKRERKRWLDFFRSSDEHDFDTEKK